MSKRPPNELESKLHQAALTTPKKELTARQTEAIIPDASARQSALNFLLGVGLLKSLVDNKGSVSFRAVTRDELIATKDLTGEENVVLSRIKASHTEGIWTKHLKTATNLHQTVLDKCLKTLEKKKLIKRVASVQHQTRKIYMLYDLEPSIALTGGPWYTDNEFDTEFIQHLSGACLKLIQDVSFPKRRSGKSDAIFPISNAPQYPSAVQIRNSLRQARLTETELSVEHVEMLLNVLVLDGQIEKIPAFGAALWGSSSLGYDESEDEEEDLNPKKKHKRSRVKSEDENSSNRRKRKKKHLSSDEDDSESGDSPPRKKSRKRMKSEEVSESESEDPKSKKRSKKKKKRSKRDETSSDEETDDSNHKSKRKHKSRKSKSSRAADSESESSSSDSESDRKERRRKKSKSSKRAQSPHENNEDFTTGGSFVYRATKQEQLSLGWSQAPCSVCPSFDFCKDGGPVNPQECVYYGDWLEGATVALEDS